MANIGDDKRSHATLEGKPNTGKHGKDYELEMSKFLFKRIIDQNFNDFSMTREKLGLGKFDDLAYIYDVNGWKRFSLVQFKHLKDETKKIDLFYLTEDRVNTKFLLSHYYKHYLDSNKEIAVDPDFQYCVLEYLILCTNIDFDKQLGSIKITEVKNNSNNKLFEDKVNSKKKLWRLSIEDKDKKTIFPDSYPCDCEQLADELLKCVMLSKKIHIKEMKKNNDVSMIKKYHVALQKYVIDSKNRCLRKEFLESDSKKPDVCGLKNCFLKSAEKFFSENKGKGVDELRTKFNVRKKKLTQLSQRILDYKKEDELLYFQKQIVPIVPNSSFGEETKYPKDEKELPRNVNQQIDEFLNKLIFAVNQQNCEAILEVELDKEVYNKFDKVMRKWYYDGCYIDHNNLICRNWITKKKMMEQALGSKINFQGEKIDLKNILPLNIEKQFLDPGLLMRTFCSMKINIGQKPDELVAYHIDRKLLRSTVLRDDVFKRNKEDVFVVLCQEPSPEYDFAKSLLPPGESLIPLQDVNANTRFFFTSKRDEFDNFAKKYSKVDSQKNLHLINFFIDKAYRSHGISLFCEKTHGSFKELQSEYLDDIHLVISEDEYIQNVVDLDTFSIVVAEPGMGKSTLAKSLGKIFAEQNTLNVKKEFIIKVELKYYWKEIKDLKVEDIKNVASFLTQLYGFKENKFLSDVIKHFLINEERIILLFDGFDELYDEETRQNMLKLLDFLLKETKVKHVCVTSRLRHRNELEQKLGVISYSIKEITKEEQINFLVKFCKPENDEKAQIIRENSENLVDNFNEVVFRRGIPFLGIPLQTHMFAFVYEKELSRESTDIPKSLPVSTIFETFLLRKYEIYIEQKRDIKITDQNRADMQEELEKYDNLHQYFALRFGGLFDESFDEYIKLFFKNVEEWENEDEEGLEECSESKEKQKRKRIKNIVLQTGILYEANDVMYFTHRTFAEFLVVKRFLSFALKKDNSKYKEALEKILVNKDNSFLLYLFDQHLLEKQKLPAPHKAAMTGDKETLKSLSKDELETKDCLGRTPIYFALQCHKEDEDILDNFVEKGMIFNLEEFTYTSLIPYLDKESVYGSLIKFTNFVIRFLQIEDSDFLTQLEQGKNVNLEKEIPNWKRLEGLIKRLNELKDYLIYSFDIEYEVLLRTMKAVLSRISPENQDKNAALNLFLNNFNFYFFNVHQGDVTNLNVHKDNVANLHVLEKAVNLSLHDNDGTNVPEQKHDVTNVYAHPHDVTDVHAPIDDVTNLRWQDCANLLQELEKRLQLFRPDHCGVLNVYLLFNDNFIIYLSRNSPSLKDFFEGLNNFLNLYFQFCKLMCENCDLFSDDIVNEELLFKLNFFIQYEIVLNIVKIDFQMSLSSLKKNYEGLSQEEKEDVDTVTKYKAELGISYEEYTIEEDIDDLLRTLIDTSDFERFQSFVENIRYATLEWETEDLRNLLKEAEKEGWLKAAVRVSEDLFKDWEECFKKGIEGGKYEHFYSRFPIDVTKVPPPEEMRQLISEYKKKI